MLADELFRQGQDVGIFAGVHRNSYLADLPSGIVRGFKVKRYPSKTGWVFPWLNHGVSQLLMNSWQPDVIHETYYSVVPRLKSSAVRVTTVYDMIHELLSEHFSKRDKTTEWKKATFSRVDHILSISESTKRDLIELFGLPEEKISVVYLGVDLSAFKVEKSKMSNKENPYLLYVGGRGGYKNFSGFIKAFASSPELKANLDVIAFGGGGMNASEQQLIRECGLDVAQIRQVSGDDQKLAQLYANAEAFVYPSLYEGFGLPPLEAMAAGCPVVSSNTSSMPEVVRKAGVYFNPSDLEDMRDAIERVVFSQELKRDLISLGYENIKYFSWEKCATQTLDVYQKLTGKV